MRQELKVKIIKIADLIKLADKLDEMSVADRLDTLQKKREQGDWIPASGGTEEPFMKDGYRLLYVYQPSTGNHAYLNLDTDLILSREEVDEIFSTTR